MQTDTVETTNITADEVLSTLKQGVVVRKSRGKYWVMHDGVEVMCTISALLRKRLIYPTRDPNSLSHYEVQHVGHIEMVDPVAIGDRVSYLLNMDGTGQIKEVLPRERWLSRRDPGPIPLEQVLVANIDQIVTVFAAARPKPSWRLLDRYLVIAESAGIPVIICITKQDLNKRDAIAAQVELYRELGYPVLLTSTITGQGIPTMRDVLTDKFSVLVGKSGVGKTSLLNAVQDGLGLRVSAVSTGKVGKGRHTTTHLEMFPLDAGGGVVDTPGMREIGFWKLDQEDVTWAFRELRPYLGQCRFGASCGHDSEPGCAIKAAVDAGDVTIDRYESFLTLLNEVT